MNETRKIKALLLVCGGLLVCALWVQGLPGGFLLDDTPNLRDLAFVNDFPSAITYVTSNNSGPLGRPISMFSFALQAESWPSNPQAFKQVNILIHLINTGLIFWISIWLLRYLSVPKDSAFGIAVLVALVWGMAPIQISSVLYVVQRMTLLSSTFILLGCVVYLRGRERLLLSSSSLNKTLLLIMLVTVLALLAAFTKESGLLLYVYIFAIEFGLLYWLPVCLHQSVQFEDEQTLKERLRWLHRILWLGVLVGVSGAIYFFDYFSDGFAGRDFSMSERILTEGRILWSYLQVTALPAPSDLSLYHDDYVISKGWLHPVSTVVAFAGWALLIAFSWAMRRRFPVLLFVVAWFFAGQVLESTIIALELYFEHRNYVVSYGVWFILVYSCYLLHQTKRIKGGVIGFGLAVYLLMILSLTWIQVNMWSNPAEQKILASAGKPNSVRADFVSILGLYEVGQFGLVDQRIDQSIQKFGNYATYETYRLFLHCDSGGVMPLANGVVGLEYWQAAKYDHGAEVYINKLANTVAKNGCEKVSMQYVQGLIAQLQNNPHFKSRRIKDSLLRISSLGFVKLGEFESGANALRAISHKNINDYVNIATAYAMLGDKAEVLVGLAEIKELSAKNPDALKKIGFYREELESLRRYATE